MSNNIIINNKIFKDCLKISPSSFYVFMCIKQYIYDCKKEMFLINDIDGYISLLKGTFITNIKELILLEHLSIQQVKEQNKHVKKIFFN